MCVNDERTMCQQLGTLAQEDTGLAAEVRWGCRHPAAGMTAAGVGEGLNPATGTGPVCHGHSCWGDWGKRGTQPWLRTMNHSLCVWARLNQKLPDISSHLNHSMIYLTPLDSMKLISHSTNSSSCSKRSMRIHPLSKNSQLVMVFVKTIPDKYRVCLQCQFHICLLWSRDPNPLLIPKSASLHTWEFTPKLHTGAGEFASWTWQGKYCSLWGTALKLDRYQLK